MNTEVNDRFFKYVSYVKAVSVVGCRDQACMTGYVVSLKPVQWEAALPFSWTKPCKFFGGVGVGFKCLAEQSRQ